MVEPIDRNILIITGGYNPSDTSYVTDLATAISQIGSENKTLIVDGPISISTAITVPTNVTLKITNREAYISKSGSATLTINGPFEAGNHTVFSGFTTGITFGAASGTTLNPRWWGATGNGTTDDAVAIQSAFECIRLSGGGHVHFPRGSYSIGSLAWGSANALAIDFTAAQNTLPIKVTGDNATLTHATDVTKIMFNIAGSVANGYAQNVTVEGLYLVGTRTPTDTDIDASQGNQLLYLTCCENSLVTGNILKNTNAGMYFNGTKKLTVVDNKFLDCNGGCQGTNAENVTIADNQFICTKKADDQIGVFGTSALTSKNIKITGNIVDKGYDGVSGYGGSAGTNRAYAHACIIGDYVYNVTIDGNTFVNINSVNASDIAAGGLGAIHIANSTSNGGPIRITNNLIRNCRFGIKQESGYSTETDVINNRILYIETNPIVLQSYKSSVIGNQISNFGNSTDTGLSAIFVTGIDDTKVTNNIITKFDVIYPIRISMGATVNVIDISNNTVYTSNTVTQAATAAGILAASTADANVTINFNSINFPGHLYSAQLTFTADSVLQCSENVFTGFTYINGVFFAVSPLVVSTGNYEIPDGQTASLLRNKGLKKPNPLNNQGLSYVFGVTGVTDAPTGTWYEGDIVYPYVATVGSPRGWVCTSGSTSSAFTSIGNL